MTPHPTQIFLHSPQALRVEFRLDDAALELWWSPHAGESSQACYRNFSNRDNHLSVFETINFADCELGGFVSCDYDAYHCVLHFQHRSLHLGTHPRRSSILVWSDRKLNIDFKTARYDQLLGCSERRCSVEHSEPAGRFRFDVRLGKGNGGLRFSPVHSPWNSHYFQALLDSEQAMEISVSLEAGREHPEEKDFLEPDAWLREADSILDVEIRQGAFTAPDHPELEMLRRGVIRGLHSMIDNSGAFRASLKAIYYLIWVRDAAFTFHYQAAAGWPHKLRELCELLLSNPTNAVGADIPRGRMFAQLIHPAYGKYEEDGLFYVVLTLFNYWTLTGDRRFFEGEARELLLEALRWVESYCFDETRGMFGGFFADETPALGSRDYGWDFAIGKPAGDEHIITGGKPVTRSYDIYLNTLMHSVYVMLSAALGENEGRSLLDRAARLERGLARFLGDRQNGLPWYGELLCSDGSVEKVPAWGPVSSVFVWALSLPNFLNYQEREEILRQLMLKLLENPQMHWVNGLCATAAALDPWIHGEELQLRVLCDVAREAQRPGKFLPMGGAVPEKFGAQDGDLFHDIRPQGFAMGTWLGACCSLGVRRLPYGLAVRPTATFSTIKDFQWAGRMLDFEFASRSNWPALEINGLLVRHTLQLPEGTLSTGRVLIRLIEDHGGPAPLWISSSVCLLEVSENQWVFESFGLSEITLAHNGSHFQVRTQDGAQIPFQSTQTDNLHSLRFTYWGLGFLVRF